MTLDLATWDPRNRAAFFLDLVNIDTPDGDAGFILGQDGQFTDINAKTWWGSQALTVPKLQTAINGVAPAGRLRFAWIQDPSAPDLIDQLRDLGLAYIDGREITFWLQPLNSVAEFQAPVLAPELHTTRIMRSIDYGGQGAAGRWIEIGFEAWTEDRKAARRVVMNTEGHKTLTGTANPSLTYMPTENFEEEALFG